jgi:hypothetical protein
MKLSPCLIPHTKFKSKWVRDLEVKAKIKKLLEGNEK